MLHGHQPRIPDEIEQEILEAFRTGNPETAFTATRSLLQAYRAIFNECAQLRFQVNFGSDRCQTCSGLHAGPDVTATCFQIRKCNYTNIRTDDTSSKQRQIIQSLLDP